MNVLTWWSELEPATRSELLDNPGGVVPESARAAVVQAGGQTTGDGRLAGLFAEYVQASSLLRAMDLATDAHRGKIHEYLDTSFVTDAASGLKHLTTARVAELDLLKAAMDEATDSYYAFVGRPKPGAHA